MFLLDSDTISHLLQGNPQVVERIRVATRPVCCPSVTRIEILRGRFQSIMAAENGAKILEAQQRLERTEAFLNGLRLLPINEAVAQEFDRLLVVKKLKKIGRGDLIIAAIALANRAILVSRNRKDFILVPGLPLENWVD